MAKKKSRKPRPRPIGRKVFDLAVGNYIRDGYLAPALIFDMGPNYKPTIVGVEIRNEADKDILAKHMAEKAFISMIQPPQVKSICWITEAWMYTPGHRDKKIEIIQVLVIRDDLWNELYTGRVNKVGGRIFVQEDDWQIMKAENVSRFGRVMLEAKRIKKLWDEQQKGKK